MLIDVEHRAMTSQNMDRLLREDTECRTSRQRTVNHIIGWANMLHPLPEIPFADKVSLSRIMMTLIGSCELCGSNARGCGPD